DQSLRACHDFRAGRTGRGNRQARPGELQVEPDELGERAEVVRMVVAQVVRQRAGLGVAALIRQLRRQNAGRARAEQNRNPIGAVTRTCARHGLGETVLFQRDERQTVIAAIVALQGGGQPDGFQSVDAPDVAIERRIFEIVATQAGAILRQPVTRGSQTCAERADKSEGVQMERWHERKPIRSRTNRKRQYSSRVQPDRPAGRHNAENNSDRTAPVPTVMPIDCSTGLAAKARAPKALVVVSAQTSNANTLRARSWSSRRLRLKNSA